MADHNGEPVTSGTDLELLERIKGPADLKKLSIDQLPQLAAEIRHAICDQVSRTGGHLAPNLGVVELTIALHYVFDFAHDRLLFDVGHQCYPHKLLTGRLELLPKLRTREGMAGFPEPKESPYDLFSVGHAGTSIPTAVGMARADTILGQGDRCVVALVGDASIVNGVAMEGLNNAGTLKRQFLAVLNDNGMSIAIPQGALAGYFDRVRVSHTYDDFKKRAQQVLKRIPGGSIVKEVYHRLGEMTKAALSHDHMFEHFGLLCVGPIDGHDIPTLVGMLSEVKDIDRPVLLHCKTVKGKGYDFAEGDATTFHSPKPFVVEGCRVELKKGGRSFTAAYADAMIDLMDRDEKIFAVTAAMPDGTGLSKVMPRFPDRTLDTGICESHAMDMCAGMAKAGLKPFFAVYSTFSQRALDQVFQEVALQGLPVRVCMDRAGYVGGDGAIHHGFMDVAMFRVFPKAVLLAPIDEPTLRAGLEFMRCYDAGPSFIRYPRDSVAATAIQPDPPPFELAKANLVRPSRSNKPDIAIVAYGVLLYEALEAVEDLERQGYDVAIYDARFAKPVDIDLIKSLIDRGTSILTVEDHSLAGGFGSCVLDACSDHRIRTDLIHRLGMPQRWVCQDSRANQLAETGLDAAGIARRVRLILDDASVRPEPVIHVEVIRAKLIR
ncbi:MAG: 1-deoxy-D-xylulose-5-phosphate synthase [Phycisphaeraceae bacterium]